MCLLRLARCGYKLVDVVDVSGVGGVGVGVSVDDMGWIEERRTDYQSALRSSFFFARNMLKRAFVLMSLTPRFTSSLAVGLGSALPR